MNRTPPTFVVTVPTAEAREDLGRVPHDVEVIVWAMDSPAPRTRIDIVVVPHTAGRENLARLDKTETRLLQGESIGYEEIAQWLPSGRVFANAASVHESATAELAVALTLAAQRRFAEFVRAQDRALWQPEWSPGLAERRVLLLGYGGVGKAIASRLAAFEVELVVVAARARREAEMHVHGVEELAELLPDADIVILALPGGPSTRHIIDDDSLAALPDGALVVNVGRGSLIDHVALLDHARRGRIRAALDVTEPAQLPADHPLWSTPGVLMVPHVGGYAGALRPRLAALLRQQIDRMRRGETPLNIVIDGS